MVKIDVITTRGGDLGETSLGDGTRVAKDALRIHAMGEVDEANATLGLLRLHTQGDAEADAVLARVQNEFFDLGADLCVPGVETDRLRVADAQCARIEREIKALNDAIPPLRSFVLPGGSPGAAVAHVARTVTRRAERACVALSHAEPLNPAIIRYLTRVSDLLFVLARRMNDNGVGDVTWTPGATR